METLKLGIYISDQNGDIKSKREIEANWSVDVEDNLMKSHSIHAVDAIANIIVENLKIQITPQIIKDMLGEIKENEK